MNFKNLIIKLEKFESLKHIQKKWLFLIAGSIVAIALILAVVFVSNSILNYPYVYKGVKVDGIEVGGMSKSQLEQFLTERYDKLLNELNITLFTDSYEEALSLSEIGVTADIEAMRKKAFEVGRAGAFPGRLSQISKLKKKPVNIELIVRYDQEKLDTIIEDINRLCAKELVVPRIVISGDKVTLYTGVSGREADRDALKKKIITSLNEMKSSYLNIPIKAVEPPRIDIETVYTAILQDPADAEIIKTEDGSADIKPHVNGRSIDKVKLKEIIRNVENREYQVLEEIELPVEIQPPKVKTEDLKALLFRDTISSYSTAFNTNNVNNRNRGINIRLAADTINGKVIFPGEEFSFNDVVGPRTREKGYQIAHFYTDGGIGDTYGGGICQVSTTLYDAALLANLSVTERHNHTFTVGYVPLGLDAAVSFGYYDFKFKNTTNYPIKIKAVSTENSISFSILGTNEYPDVYVKLSPRILSTSRITTVYIDDPNLPPGAEIVEDSGMDGAVVDTYVKIYSGDELVNQYKLHQSTYKMLPRKIRRGAKN